MPDLTKKFIQGEHPVYTRYKEEWTFNEKVYRATRAVRDELMRFQWEEEGGEHYERRQRMAAFMPFPTRMAGRFVGYLAREAPAEDETGWGTLGDVRPRNELDGTLSQAELLYYDTDRHGQTWTSFWNTVQRWTMVTGHRWVGVETPSDDQGVTRSQADEQQGLHPYLVHLSPLDAPNWVERDGQLRALVIKTNERVINDGGQYSGKFKDRYVLYVAEGYEQLGEAYAAGGWWMYDEKHNPLEDENGEQLSGDLQDTDGVIPYVPFFYVLDDKDYSLPGLTDVCAVAVQYMNLTSARYNDAFEGGGRHQYILGGNIKAFNDMANQKKEGSRVLLLEPTRLGDQTVVPSVWDSASVSAAGSIKEALQALREEAAIIALDEMQRGPNSSGEARKVEFINVKAPRLSLMAFHRESAEQKVLRLAEQRFGHPVPGGRVTWTKSFDVETNVEDWMTVFDAMYEQGVESPTLTNEGLKQILQGKGIRLDQGVLATIEEEIRGSFQARQRSRDALADQLPDQEPPDEQENE